MSLTRLLIRDGSLFEAFCSMSYGGEQWQLVKGASRVGAQYVVIWRGTNNLITRLANTFQSYFCLFMASSTDVCVGSCHRAYILGQ